MLPPDGDDTRERRIVLRYCGEGGELSAEANPSGAEDNIAGIANSRGNVLGMMPHPERSFERIFGSEDGRRMFESVVFWIESHVGLAGLKGSEPGLRPIPRRRVDYGSD